MNAGGTILKGSLDTNIIIDFYNAGLEGILFDMFDEGLFVHEFIRDVELANHGGGILNRFDADVTAGKIIIYTNRLLFNQGILSYFNTLVNKERHLYSPQDMGEVYCICLAQILGGVAVLTNDTKQGGPYMSLLNRGIEVMPLNFVDILVLRYLLGEGDISSFFRDFNTINKTFDMPCDRNKRLNIFKDRFISDAYEIEEKDFLVNLVGADILKERLSKLI